MDNEITTRQTVGFALVLILGALTLYYGPWSDPEGDRVLQLERKLRQMGCTTYEYRLEGKKFLDCFTAEITGLHPLPVKEVVTDVADQAVIGCARSERAKWCEVWLFDPNEGPVLAVTREEWKAPADKEGSVYTVTLLYQLFGAPHAEVVESWALLTDSDRFAGGAIWFLDSAKLITEALRGTETIRIVPDEIREGEQGGLDTNAAVDLTAGQISVFQEYLELAEGYVTEQMD